MDDPKKQHGSSKFSELIALQVLELAREGMTDDQICAIVGVNRTTLWRWKNKNPDFAQLLKNSKDIADDMVEAALFKRATGYSHKETKYMVVSMGRDSGSEIQERDTIKEYPPDTKAAMFWLQNRRRDKWQFQMPEDEEMKREIVVKFDRDKKPDE